MRTNIFKLIVTLFLIVFLVSLTGCEEEEVDHVQTVTLYRQEENYLVGNFNYEDYSFMVQYDDGTKKEVFLNEDMIDDYDKIMLLQEGKHTIYAKVLGKSIEITVTGVTKQITGVTLKNVSGDYTGSPYSVKVEGVIPPGAQIEYVPKNEFVEAGVYDVTAIISCDNYETLRLNATVTINKAVYDLSTFVFEDYTTTYTGEPQSLAIKGEMNPALSYYYTISTKPTVMDTDQKLNSAVNAGEYYVTLHMTGDKYNYSTENLTITKKLTIKKQEVELDTKDINMKDMIVQYDGKYHSILLNEEKLPSNVSVDYVNNNQINAGVYEVKAVFTLTDSLNYTIGNNLTATLTITKADYDMTGISMPVVECGYDGYSHSIQLVGTLPRGVELEYYENNNQVKAGVYDVIAHFKITDKNHNPVEPITGKLTINKASFSAVDLNLEGGSFVYDGNYHDVKLVGTLPAGVQVIYKTWNEKSIDLGSVTRFNAVGFYTVMAEFKFEKENYEDYSIIPDIYTTLEIKRRVFDENNQLDVEDFEYVYDGTNHGTGKDTVLPSWAKMKSFTLLDSQGNLTDVAVNAGNYFYYYSFEYFDGVETVITRSETATISITPIYMYNNNQYTIDNMIQTTYSGNPVDYSVKYNIPIVTEELMNDIQVVCKNGSNEVVEEAINAGGYIVEYTLTDSTNYKFDAHSYNVALYIDCKGIYVDDNNSLQLKNIYMTFDGEEHFPDVTRQPEHTRVIFTKTITSNNVVYYNATLAVENSNYQLVGPKAETIISSYVTYFSMNVREILKPCVYFDNAKVSCQHPSNTTMLNSSTLQFIDGTYLNYTLSNWNVNYLFTYANGEDYKLTLEINTRYSSIVDCFDLEICDVYYRREDGRIILLNSFDSYADLEDYTLSIATDNINNFNANGGTPYGDYYIFTKFNMDSSLNNYTSNVTNTVTIIRVSKEILYLSEYFEPKKFEWTSDVNDPTPYKYTLSQETQLPEGIYINYKDSVLETSYEEQSFKIAYNANINMYGITSGEYYPGITIDNKQINISKVVVRNSSVTYNESNHQHDWTTIDKIQSMPDDLLDLYHDGLVDIELDTLDGNPAIIPGTYRVCVRFISNNEHLVIINTGNTDRTPVINSLIIIEKKMITTAEIENAAKNAVIVRGSNVTEDKVTATIDYVEKADNYQKTLCFANTISNDFKDNIIMFTRGETTNRYNSPLSGMILTSVEYTNDYGDLVFSTEDNIYIRKSDTMQEHYNSLMTPVIHEYMVLHYELDEYTALIDSSATTYDLYIRSDSYSLLVSPEKQKVAYNNSSVGLEIENQDVIGKTLNFKYVDEYGTESNTPLKYEEIGEYTIIINVYKFDDDGNNILIGVINKNFEITKIKIENTYLNTYVQKTVDWTGTEISSFTTIPGYVLPDHVQIESFTYDGSTTDEAPKFTGIGNYDIKITLSVDDDVHYELSDGQEEFNYTFSIVKVRVSGELLINNEVIDQTGANVGRTNNGTITFNLGANYNNSDFTVTYDYSYNENRVNNVDFTGSNNILATPGTYTLFVNVRVNNKYNGNVVIGRYVDGVFVEYDTTDVGSGAVILQIEYDNIVVYDVLDPTKVNMVFAGINVTGTTKGIVVDENGTEYNVLFTDISCAYNGNGYTFNINPTDGYYQIDGTILVNMIYGSFNYGVSSSNSIVLLGINSYKLVCEELVPGEYYIMIGHDTTIAAQNGGYTEYLGIHLTIK